MWVLTILVLSGKELKAIGLVNKYANHSAKPPEQAYFFLLTLWPWGGFAKGQSFHPSVDISKKKKKTEVSFFHQLKMLPLLKKKTILNICWRLLIDFLTFFEGKSLKVNFLWVLFLNQFEVSWEFLNLTKFSTLLFDNEDNSLWAQMKNLIKLI